MTRRALGTIVWLGALLLTGACGGPADRDTAPAVTPQAAVDELLAADRQFSKASASTDLISGLSAMFAPDVIAPVPGNRFAEGAASAVDALRSNPENAASRIEWTPVRGGISADGQHGFTFGYMTLHKPDGSRMPLKYLSYWIKRPEGWRVAVYRRRPAPEGAVSLDLRPPALPPRIVPPTSDTSAVDALRESLDRTERDFSRDAQTMGLGPAFARYGSGDAVNMGGPKDAEFVVGAESIARAVSQGEPPTGSSVSWGPDKVFVASSGDLGITIGFIRPNRPPSEAGQPTAFPFFTIWRRASTSDPWRYVAE